MKGWLFILGLMFFAACTNTTKVPEGIYPREKMENVLWDMIIADRFSAQFLLKDSSKIDVKLETMKMYNQVFKMNNTTHEEFVKSYKYYLNRPDLTKTIFDSLASRANKNRDEMYKYIK